MNKSLEGVRGTAALLVVAYHMGGDFNAPHALDGGYLAVDLFFVLSGFVICAAYANHINDGADLRNFMVRRFGRLYPAYIVSTFAYFALLNLVSTPLRGEHVAPTSGELAAILTLTQSFPMFGHFVGSPVTWSISSEFYVYVLFGALCLALRGRARVLAFAVLSAIGLAVAIYQSLIVHSCITRGACLNGAFDFGYARCLTGFFAGALVANYRHHASVVAFTRPLTQMLAFALAVAVICSAGRATAFAAPVAFAVLVASLSSDSGPIARLFTLRPFQMLGAGSYALYLAHDIFRPYLDYLAPHAATAATRLALAGAFLAISFVSAYLLHVAVENPFRARFHAWTPRRAPVATA
ncbi:acyltransferase [Paraburkholderia phymatum]|uniref:acyltransferase family protein n=1 Tax=Paraburkholderia phymatum TaxID=148447 RepID=UPI003177FD32